MFIFFKILITYCRYVTSLVLSVVQVMLESWDRLVWGRDFSDSAEETRLWAECILGDRGVPWWSLEAWDMALIARMTSPSQPEDSANAARDL